MFVVLYLYRGLYHAKSEIAKNCTDCSLQGCLGLQVSGDGGVLRREGLYRRGVLVAVGGDNLGGRDEGGDNLMCVGC